ncbi:MAG: NAD(P)-dependent glycerol-3-phosphate dehydrogenase [Deltaproteobacteria bacterium]|nr:NAD(P)-dependent glycerol-3-phosphate dehydrogenase [Deltaproteobacteria bacterium]
MEKFAVIGGGGWGTTLADILAQKGLRVWLWVRNPGLRNLIEEGRENPVYLPGARLSDNLRVTSSLGEALEHASHVVCAVPSHGIRDVFTKASPHIPEKSIIVSVSKGIEETTLLTPSGIISEILPRGFRENIVILSGPTFAKEVILRLPAAACAAGENEGNARSVQEAFSTPYFRIYTNPDPAGVELGGALKNVIAIAVGISDGLGLGGNARAALITRGLKEISRLGIKMNGKERTFYGLSGLGDLVLTATGELSRNRNVGLQVGRGRRLREILTDMRMVAEGVRTSLAVRELARNNRVEMPITEQVCEVLYGDKPPKEAVMELMTRELKGES